MPSGNSPAHTTSSSPIASTPFLDQGSITASPAVSSGFSQADTLLTHDSHYTANTGGRARQSWRGRNLARLNSFLSNDLERKNSRRRGPANGSPSEISPVAQQESPVVQPPMSELPATPIAETGPDEPRSFFDSGSESDSSHSGRNDTIVSRASSVRVQRPLVVEHHPSNLHRSHSPAIQDAADAPSSTTYLSGSLSKAKQVLGDGLKSLTPEPAESNPNLPVPTSARSTAALTDADSSSKSTLKQLSLTNPDQASTSASASAEASTIALPPTPHSQNTIATTIIEPSASIRRTILEAPDTPTRAEALDTLPTPLGGFGSLRLNPLRSNPVSASEIHDSQLHRAISAPLIRFNPTISSTTAATKGLHRKVTIRPSDLVITDSKGHHRLFRESVVSTPCPSTHDTARRQHLEEELSSAVSAREAQSATDTVHSDRFPSPSRAETLFLCLALAACEEKNVRVEIAVKDRATFDDEALFTAIRTQYRRELLGWPRRVFSARQLHRVTAATNGVGEFDNADFLAHLTSPRSGHKRKTWLLWLRSQQADEKSVAGTGAPWTATSTPLPRMPFASPASSNSNSHNESRRRHGGVPRITLHRAFSAPRIGIAVLAVLLASIAATVLWVLLGPGPVFYSTELSGTGVGAFGVGMGAGEGSVSVPWRIDAQARILTGLVLGVLVFLLGALGLGAWVGGSWVLM